MADSSQRLITLISTIFGSVEMDMSMMEYRIVPWLKRITDICRLTVIRRPNTML